MLDYVYDKIGRIESATNKQTGSSEKFSFDPANNILSDGLKDKGRLNNSAHLYAGNRLKEYNGTEYTYDALGNLIYRQLPNGENQYFVYDTENQLTRAEIKKPAGNTEIWEYAYDPFGRRLSKERKDKLAWVSTEPKRTHFVWDGSRLLQEYTYKGDYTYIYTDQDSYEPLAQVFLNGKDEKQYLAYFHTDQIGIPREMTDQFGNLLWYGEYTAWGRLKKDERVYKDMHQPFRLQNQYCDQETGLHYNFFRYYEPDTGRFVNQDPIGLDGGNNLYFFAPNTLRWADFLGLSLSPVTITLSAVPGMPHREFQRKAESLKKLGDEGKLRKIEKVERDPSITKCYKSDLIKRIWRQYGTRNPDFAKKLIHRVKKRMQPDHVWELQLSGPDSRSNLRMLDSFTNWHIGTQQIRPQIRNLPAGTPIKIRIR